MGTKTPPRPFSGASVYLTASETIPNATVLVVPWDAAHFDTDNYFSLALPARLTAPVAGLYRITVNDWWSTNSVGSRFGSFRINGFQIGFAYAMRASSLGGTVGTASVLFEMTEGAFATTHKFQNSGVALLLLGAIVNSRFQIQLVGRL